MHKTCHLSAYVGLRWHVGIHSSLGARFTATRQHTLTVDATRIIERLWISSRSGRGAARRDIIISNAHGQAPKAAQVRRSAQGRHVPSLHQCPRQILNHRALSPAAGNPDRSPENNTFSPHGPRYTMPECRLRGPVPWPATNRLNQYPWGFSDTSISVYAKT